jgi:SAM-dependent methyltransferase
MYDPGSFHFLQIFHRYMGLLTRIIFLGYTYRLESDSFWFRYRNRLILRAMETNFICIDNVLEIGCGTGFVLSEVHSNHPNFKLYGSDLYLEGLKFARARMPGADFYQMDACKMPFVEEFDLILALDILEHIEDDSKALDEIYRSLRTGGGLIVTVPQHEWLWSRQDEKAFHQRRYVKKELMQKLMDGGFRIVRTTSFITLLLPFMIISRLYAQLAMSRQKEYDPLRELKIAPMVNRMLGLVCSVEQHILERGISLPTGGSLLCIGKKVS